jgi:hypothetical protein
MRLSVVVLSVFALLAFSGTVQAGRTAPLVDPAPVSVPAGATEGSLVKDIKRALLGRGWTITAERPGEIDSTLSIRDHEAKIRITYDLQSVRFAYVDSKNLNYRLDRKGKAEIHANYLGWIKNLTNDLGVNLQLSQTP